MAVGGSRITHIGSQSFDRLYVMGVDIKRRAGEMGDGVDVSCEVAHETFHLWWVYVEGCEWASE